HPGRRLPAQPRRPCGALFRHLEVDHRPILAAAPRLLFLDVERTRHRPEPVHHPRREAVLRRPHRRRIDVTQVRDEPHHLRQPAIPPRFDRQRHRRHRDPDRTDRNHREAWARWLRGALLLGGRETRALRPRALLTWGALGHASTFLPHLVRASTYAGAFPIL